MSHWDYLKDAKAGIALLRRLDNGDESAYKEIEPLLKRIDDRDAAHVKADQEKRERSAKRRQGDRKLSGKFTLAPSSENGVNYSASGIVLLQKGETRLVWRSGGNYWSGIRQAYAPADLEILYPHDGYSLNQVRSTDLTSHHSRKLDGDRTYVAKLSKKLVMEHAAKIDEVFGAGAAERAAELKGTVTL